jgi:hypothetical protein
MPSANVNDYPAFREFAARFGPDQASWVKLGIEWRTDEACKAARARMRVGERARPGRYGELLAIEVGRACATRAAWESCAREHERRHAAFEAQLVAERRWTGLRAEIDRRRPNRPTRVPATTIRATVAPTRPAPAALPARPVPVVADPRAAHAAHLEAKGFLYAAEAERKRIRDADHQARRRAVEERVAADERLFASLCRNFGDRYAERFMEGGD